MEKYIGKVKFLNKKLEKSIISQNSVFMTETTEKPNNWLNKRVSRRTVLKVAGGLAAGGAGAIALSSFGVDNKNKVSDDTSQEPTQNTIAKQEKTPDKILSPEETNARIQEFIPKIDSLYSKVQIAKPKEFPDTNIIRTTNPRGLTDKKMPSQFQTSITEEDYLTADGVKKLAQNCNATDEPIKVQGIEYIKNDSFYMRYVKLNCAGVAFGLKLLAEQTGELKARSALSDWRQIHIGILSAYRIIEPPTNIQWAIDDIDQKYYQSLQK